MSYGANIPHQFRRAAEYVDKILRGAKAGRPSRRAADQVRSRRLINLTTAKALGLVVPPTLLARAGEVD